MIGHSDTVTGISLSADGSYLLSNAMDGMLRVWDVRPYAPVDRCVKVLGGHQHNFEKVYITGIITAVIYLVNVDSNML